MAIYNYYGLPTCREVVSAMSGLGVVFPSQPGIIVGGSSPFSVTAGGNTYRFYSGPEGGPHPAFTGGGGVSGDYGAWNGFRSAVAFSPQVWTAFAVDIQYDSEAQTSWAAGNTKAYIHVLHDRSSTDGGDYQYDIVLIVCHYIPALGSWNYQVSLGGGDLSGGISVGGMSLTQEVIQGIAEALAGMIQIINNVTVGDDLMPSVNEAVLKLAELVTAMGAGGVLGSLAAGGTVATSLSKLDQLVNVVTSIGTIADAVVEYQQLGKLDEIKQVLSQISGFIDNITDALVAGQAGIADRIRSDDGLALADAVMAASGNIATAANGIQGEVADVATRLRTTWDGTEYNVPAAIAAFAGGGGGGSVDLSGVIAALEEIRDAIGAGGGGMAPEELQAILDRYGLIHAGGEDISLADLIARLLNHSTINYG